jgi:ferredoxin-NADP reductase
MPSQGSPVRELYTATLEQKLLLSRASQCYHFEFTFTGSAPAAIQPGQFLSLVADDPSGKTYTRAYSIASAPRAQSFDLCVNRVPNGFFSNLLCDLDEGDTIRCHGPHGLFTLKQPPAHSLMVAAGTGIAPMRGFAQSLFPPTGSASTHEHWLIYEAPHPTEHFYHDDFQALAAQHPNFHYLPVLGSDENHHQLEEELARIPTNPNQPHDRYAYVCGLSGIVKAARAHLLTLGWQKTQILFERYD